MQDSHAGFARHHCRNAHHTRAAASPNMTGKRIAPGRETPCSRWIAIAVLAAILLYEILSLEGRMEAFRRELRPDLPEDDPRRRGFNALHRQAERLMKASVAAAFVALFFS